MAKRLSCRCGFAAGGPDSSVEELCDVAVTHVQVAHPELIAEHGPDGVRRGATEFIDDDVLVAPGFAQVIEYSTSQPEAVEKALQQWQEATEGRRPPARAITGRTRSDPSRYVVLVEFPSEQAARENEKLAETDAMARAFGELCDTGPTYRDLDVVSVGP